MKNKQKLKEFDPIESKRNKKPKLQKDPSRKNKKFYLNYSDDMDVNIQPKYKY